MKMKTFWWKLSNGDVVFVGAKDVTDARKLAEVKICEVFAADYTPQYIDEIRDRDPYIDSVPRGAIFIDCEDIENTPWGQL